MKLYFEVVMNAKCLILKAHTGDFFEIEFSCKSSVFTLGVFVVLITTGLTLSLLNGRSWLFEYYSVFCSHCSIMYKSFVWSAN